MTRLWGAVMAGGLAVTACGDKEGGSLGAGTAAVPAAVPAPKDLAAECVLPTPDATWEKTRAQVGGPAAFLPRSAGGLAAVMLHFPIAVSEAIDGRSPAFCAATLANDGVGIGAGDREADPKPQTTGSQARAVIGLHLRWPERLVDGLTKGTSARFSANVDAATQITVFTARAPEDAVMASGVYGNYLLIAARPEDVLAVGPYVARTLPQQGDRLPTAGVKIAGAAEGPNFDLAMHIAPEAMRGGVYTSAERAVGLLGERLGAWMPLPTAVAHRLREAVNLVPEMDGADVRLTIDSNATRLDVYTTLRKGEAETAVKRWEVGDVSPLLLLPKDALAGALVRRTAPSGEAPGAQSGTKAGTGAPDGETAPGSTKAPQKSDPVGTQAPTGGTAAASTQPSATGAPVSTQAPTGGTAPVSTQSPVEWDLAGAFGLGDAKDAAALREAVQKMEASAGNWLALGFGYDGTGPSGFVRAGVHNSELLDGALKDLLALSEKAKPSDPVRGDALRVTAGKTVLENIPGDVFRLRLERAKKGTAPPGELPTSVDVLFRRQNDVFLGATGYASRDALRALMGGEGAGTLGAVAEIATPLSRYGATLIGAAFIDPGRVTASRAGRPGSLPPAAVVITARREDREGVHLALSIEGASSAVAELSRWLLP
ncbi:MAG: hypothetical protein IPK82_24160 [Polyangiaceae bacterium]|nr:hypothetical protein [Polyangiaceae bacterium]